MCFQMHQQWLLSVERLRTERTLEVENSFVLLSDMTPQVPLITIRSRTLLAFERLIPQVKLDMGIQQTLLGERDRTQMAFEGTIFRVNRKVSFEKAFCPKSATTVFALELVLCIM